MFIIGVVTVYAASFFVGFSGPLALQDVSDATSLQVMVMAKCEEGTPISYQSHQGKISIAGLPAYREYVKSRTKPNPVREPSPRCPPRHSSHPVHVPKVFRYLVRIPPPGTHMGCISQQDSIVPSGDEDGK